MCGVGMDEVYGLLCIGWIDIGCICLVVLCEVIEQDEIVDVSVVEGFGQVIVFVFEVVLCEVIVWDD